MLANLSYILYINQSELYPLCLQIRVISSMLVNQSYILMLANQSYILMLAITDLSSMLANQSYILYVNQSELYPPW